MKLIIPMAGYGKRLRPQSSITPKPLMTVRGQCMVERIVEKFTHTLPRPVTDGVFILGPGFDRKAYGILDSVCDRHGIQAHYVIQEEAKGTAHAVICAQDFLAGEGIVVYADTVFDMDPVHDLHSSDVVAWVKEVEDPSRFGVAVREGDQVTAFVEKPKEFISNEALIGIYYIRQLEKLQEAIQVLFNNNICGKGGEYYLTDAFDGMLKQGLIFRTAAVNAWLDCGTLDAFMDTTRYLLDHEPQTAARLGCTNSIIHEPVYIADGAVVKNSVIGPYVSVEADAHITDSIIRDSIIFESAHVQNSVLHESMIGANGVVAGMYKKINVGDYSYLQ